MLTYNDAWAAGGDAQRSGFYLWGPSTGFQPAPVATEASAHLSYMIMRSDGYGGGFIGVAPTHGCMVFYGIREEPGGKGVDVLLAMRPAPVAGARDGGASE